MELWPQPAFRIVRIILWSKNLQAQWLGRNTFSNKKGRVRWKDTLKIWNKPLTNKRIEALTLGWATNAVNTLECYTDIGMIFLGN